MSELIITSADEFGIKVTNFRLQPLVTWLNSLNFITIAIICLLFLKIYRTSLLLYEWLFPFKQISEYSVILVLGPKNEIVQEIIFKLSQVFKSEIIVCQNLNGNCSEEFIPKKEQRKNIIICNHETLSTREVISEFRARVERTFGFVDILVISPVEEKAKNNSTYSFLNHLNKQLLLQFWTVMAFLPGMIRRNRGHILSVALGRTPLTNTGIMRSIHEELLQCDTEVKLTLVGSNTLLDNRFLPSLSSKILANFIVRSMWNSSAVVKVPSLPCYLIMLPVLLGRFLLSSVAKMLNHVSTRKA